MSLLDRPRLANALGALACIALLAYALYAENVLGYEPCPLCMFQRVAVLALGVVFVVAALHAPAPGWGRRFYAVLAVLAAAAVVVVAGRHVYIQSLPPGSVPSCGATLDYLLEVFPLMDVIRKVLTAGGECAKIDWRFLGLSMPVWVLFCGVVLGTYGAIVNGRGRRRGGIAFR